MKYSHLDQREQHNNLSVSAKNQQELEPEYESPCAAGSDQRTTSIPCFLKSHHK